MTYEFSVKKGDLQFIQGHWYVTHTGLVGLSSRRKLPRAAHWANRDILRPYFPSLGFKAIVYNRQGARELLWRRRPFQRFFSRPRRRDARGRNACRESCPTQSLASASARWFLGRWIVLATETANSTPQNAEFHLVDGELLWLFFAVMRFVTCNCYGAAECAER